MSGSLVKITEANISSGDATFDIGGSAWDSSYDVYKIVLSNIQLTDTSDSARINCRVLKSDNSADTTSNYDYAFTGVQLQFLIIYQTRIVINGKTLIIYLEVAQVLVLMVFCICLILTMQVSTIL